MMFGRFNPATKPGNALVCVVQRHNSPLSRRPQEHIPADETRGASHQEIHAAPDLAGGLRNEVVAIPLDRPLQALFEVDLGLEPE